MWWPLWMIACALVAVGRGQQQNCPSNCLCFRTTVRCMYLHLTDVPQVPHNTTTLDLRFNKIKEIQPAAFQNLRKLNTLLLNNNQISRLRNGVFFGLVELKHLYLYKNRIKDIEADVFKGLHKLEQLYLHFNDLVTIHPGTFNNLGALSRLFLQHNKLQKIPAGAFKNLVSLERLRLDSNALVCDCEMVWLVKMLKEQMKDTQTAAHCQQPVDMQGKSLTLMTDDDFHCRKPEIKEEPHDVEITFGGTVYFTCKADGDPQPNIVWLRNSQEVDTNPRYSVLGDGTLMIANAALDDVGVYECLARNSAGHTKSRSAVMRVGRTVAKPRFSLNPEDYYGHQGQQVSLHCTAVGQPTPKITWSRDGREIRNTDHIRVWENGTLTIRHSRVEDSGQYRCSATNFLGTINSIVFVKVVGAPILSETPKNESARAGDLVQFRCLANGQPAPTVSWYREGQLIPPGGNVALLANGQILRIERVKLSDAGQYTCIARNTAGQVFAGAWLGVEDERREAPVFQDQPYDMTVPPGATVEVPCSASGYPHPEIEWRKNSVPIDEDPQHKIASGGSLYIYNVTSADSGEYECAAVNEKGKISAKATVTVRGVTVVAGPGDQFVQRAYQEAQSKVDKAVNDTLTSLFARTTPASPGELLRILRYPNAEARQVARAAEIYEITLANVKKYVLAGMQLSLTDTKDFSYRELLSPKHLELVANLSGCMQHRPHVDCDDMCFHTKYRSLDGTCNNLRHPMWGASLTAFHRLLPSAYENGFNLPIGWTKGQKYFGFEKPNARLVSSSLLSTTDITPDHFNSHMLMQWGQFLDHDMDHAIPSLSGESYEDGVECKGSCEFASPCYPIQIPEHDLRGRLDKCMDFVRSSAICGSGGTSVLFDSVNPREQINQLTSFIDASQVYGFSTAVVSELRDFNSQDGLMRSITLPRVQGELLPLADRDFMDCRRDPREHNIGCFMAGDIRANEQVALLAMHTIWLREHNRVAKKLRTFNPLWESDSVFHEARKIVGAQMQHITFTHWLPHILGPSGMEKLGSYKGYQPDTDPRIANAFATAAFRFGHSMINPQLDRLNASFHPIPEGPLPLHRAFFSPWRLVEEGGVDPLMRGMIFSPAKLKTPQQTLNSDLTERLFSAAHNVALDLAAINIQRGRDHGLPSYNEYRQFCNLTAAESFHDLRNEIKSSEIREKLKKLYGHPGNIDLFVGGILEDQVDGGKIGPTFQCILVDQFRRLRDGDRFWYEDPAVFTPAQLTQLRQSSLAAVLCNNGDAIDRMTKDVFLLPSKQRSGIMSCEELPQIELSFWTECCEDCKSSARFEGVGRRFRRSANQQSESDQSVEKNQVFETTPAPTRRRSKNSGRTTSTTAVPTTTSTTQSTTTTALTTTTTLPTTPAEESAENEDHQEGDRPEEEDDEEAKSLAEVLRYVNKQLKKIKRKMKKLEHRIINEDSHKQLKHNSKQCTDDTGHVRLNGEIWHLDSCTQCHCLKHQITCTRNICPPLICNLPQVAITHEGECCARCTPPKA
ncbi:peroxidasin isoform X1 [Neocloeon triangulifer]|uniref:peroxidasin isoform X1 n=1 Tax=Neocloeon triangulifer TaxID=2078957 RepID=UPI00286EB840|nr:peroxidasin isoform X1 [Neocloeon triangulifer]